MAGAEFVGPAGRVDRYFHGGQTACWLTIVRGEEELVVPVTLAEQP